MERIYIHRACLTVHALRIHVSASSCNDEVVQIQVVLVDEQGDAATASIKHLTWRKDRLVSAHFLKGLINNYGVIQRNPAGGSTWRKC